MYSQNQNVLLYVSGYNYITKSLLDYIRNDSDEIKKITQLKKYICYSDSTSNLNGMKQMIPSLGDINLT